MRSHYPDIIVSEAELSRLAVEQPDAIQISIMGFGISSLDTVTRFGCLRGLSISGMYHTGSQPDQQDTVRDFSALSRLTELVDLSVHDCRFFDDDALHSVSQMPRLQKLTISLFMNTLSDVTVLGAMRELRELDLRGYYRWHADRSFWRKLIHGYHCDLDRQLDELCKLLPGCDVLGAT